MAFKREAIVIPRSAAITVCIPTYKRPTYLKRALQSVLAQTEQDFQIIIGDNGGDKETRQIVEEFADPRIQHYVHARDIGLSANWDFVIHWPTSGYCALLEDDNYWEPWHLSEACQALAAYPETAFYHSAIWNIWECDEKQKKLLGRPYWHDVGGDAVLLFLRPRDTIISWLASSQVTASSVVLRRNIFGASILFDGRFSHYQDHLAFGLLSIQHPILYSKKPSAYHTYHGENLSLKMQSKRTGGREVRSVRRILGEKALSLRLLDEENAFRGLAELDPGTISQVVTSYAHPRSPLPLRRIAFRLWREYPSCRRTSGYLRLSSVFGFWVLGLVDNFDRLLSKLPPSLISLLRKVAR